MKRVFIVKWNEPDDFGYGTNSGIVDIFASESSANTFAQKKNEYEGDENFWYTVECFLMKD